jgi:hypothetical protein
MREIRLGVLAAAAALVVSVNAGSHEAPSATPGCPDASPQLCVGLALDAMGGRARLEQLKSVRLQRIGRTLLVEQSYRQAPFITAYQRDVTTLDLAQGRVLIKATLTWPESDPDQSDSEATLVVGAEGGVYRGKDADTPCSLSDLDEARTLLTLGPTRLLSSALQAADLHFEAPEKLRSTLHTVVAFRWQKTPVRVLLNPFNHLPDAVETVRQFHDFWYFWGDVHQRIYFDNWKLTRGISYPTNLVEERNGILWSSTQALNVEFDVALDEKAFAMDGAIAAESAASAGWERPFSAEKDTVLAPGVDLFLGSWNSTVIRQSDGLVILEAPISSRYTQGVIEEARRRYPGVPVKAVLSTSDSWPHVGGVRFAVAQGLPVYILDLNRPLLERMMSAAHTLAPDPLQNARGSRVPDWKIVSGVTSLGAGANRLELHPLRGASTERQYMAYFPEQRLLYASDTLALNEDGSLYDPQLMHEVARAVEREHLKVETVFAMHQPPMPWSQLLSLLAKSESAG